MVQKLFSRKMSNFSCEKLLIAFCLSIQTTEQMEKKKTLRVYFTLSTICLLLAAIGFEFLLINIHF